MNNNLKSDILFVDLDGTVFKSDLLLESLIWLLRNNLRTLFFQVPFWLLKGKAYLKLQLSKSVVLNLKTQPINQQFSTYIKAEVAQGRRAILISASHESLVREVSEELDIFIDAIGSDGVTNLKGKVKLQHILHLCGSEPFSYAGNSKDDIPIWLAAKDVVCVNTNDNVVREIREKTNSKILEFDRPTGSWKSFRESLRPHQWMKNGLIFLPLVLSHQLSNWEAITNAFIGFISFCLVASAVYLLNDLLDIENDRNHQTKITRPFASGNLSLTAGFFTIPLLLAGFFLAHNLGNQFLETLLIYWLLTTFYSFFLKRFFLLDVFMLSVLYGFRIVAGSNAVHIETTNWLLTFTLFLFLGLALLKRYVELTNQRQLGKNHFVGRGYHIEDLRLVSFLGATSNLIAIFIFGFYIGASETAKLYDSPDILWVINLTISYLLLRVWRLAYHGKMQEDPVFFVLNDRISQSALVMCGLLIWLAI
tara:strand:- start:6181 stop:7614 length:1434 start_codon:yes stop_codon:yes gene_type:complete